MLKRIASHKLNTIYGKFDLFGYSKQSEHIDVIALKSLYTGEKKPTLLRVQYACTNSTVFGSIDCDCALQIKYSFNKFKTYGPGVLIYFPDYEGYNLGLFKKILLNEKEDIIGLPAFTTAKRFNIRLDEISILYLVPQILNDLNVISPIILLGNNKKKIRKLYNIGFDISEVKTINVDEKLLSNKGIEELKDKNKQHI